MKNWTPQEWTTFLAALGAFLASLISGFTNAKRGAALDDRLGLHQRQLMATLADKTLVVTGAHAASIAGAATPARPSTPARKSTKPAPAAKG